MQASPEVTNRLMFSLGYWTFLAMMLPPKDFLKLQALNRYAYRTSVARVQTRLLFYRPLIALTACHDADEGLD